MAFAIGESLTRLKAMTPTDPITRSLVTFGLIIFGTVFAHWGLIQMYASMCAPWSLTGLFYTIISLGSPFCHFINAMQMELAKHYVTIWVAAGAGLVVWLGKKIQIKQN